MGRYRIEISLFFHYNYNIMTRCFTMLKPGVVNRRLVGEVIERLEKKGFKLVGLKMMQVSNELACSHYAEHKEKPFFGELVDYITSGPVVAMVWQADDCVALMRKMCGATKPSEAMPGTIRGDYCTHTSHNIIHASDSDESAAREIALWFKEDELIDWDDCCCEKWY
jgi:nucleoside-diphosphate kinase